MIRNTDTSKIKENSPTVQKPLRMEIITPYKLSVAIFIHEFWNFRDSCEFKDAEEIDVKLLLRDYYMLLLHFLQTTDLTLDDILRKCTNLYQHSISSTFINRYTDTLHTVMKDGTLILMEIVKNMKKLINAEDSTVKSMIMFIKNSVAGNYLRRFIVYFERLTFSEFVTVLNCFKQYITASHAVMSLENMSSFSLLHKERTRNYDMIITTEHWSKRQAELFIATQASLLVNNPGKVLSPPELGKQLVNLLRSNPDLAEAHFLCYLNYLRVKEYCSAVDSLYVSFDKSTASISEDKKKSYRYAALNLAILQYHFNHKEEAMAAFKETINLAQEAGDNICLQHALAWIYCLTQCNRDKLIEHSILKCLDINLSYIMSLGILAFSQYGLTNGGVPKQIFDAMIRSEITNNQQGHNDLISYSYAQKASMWLLYGKVEMSNLWSQLLLNLHPSDDYLNRAHYGEVTCQTVCNFAHNIFLEGRYKEADAILMFAKTNFQNEPSSNIWMLYDAIFRITRLIYWEKYDEAEEIAQSIVVLDKWESCLRLAEIYFQRGDFVRAQFCVNKILLSTEDEKKHLRMDMQIRAKLILLDMQCVSSHLSGTVPLGMLTLLNSTLAQADDYHLDYHALVIKMKMANVNLLMKMPSQAVHILDGCLAHMLSHGSLYDRARSKFLHARCIVAEANHLRLENCSNILRDVTEILESVRKEFEILQTHSKVKDVYFMQAHVYNMLGMSTERNRVSMKYRQICEEKPTKKGCSILWY